ncbi:hypothetical protein GCK72_024034 [Caenorhabditis remanei]|uniref:Uncharacterized protein n=1 Tax=Caenorhabditis remanei TaxID=31234 RepID=A0A6A5FYZ4_CAERE|nr:hypothetical protein GCK72_024034 [Caenorhabditis remanei]KAF1747569.1 hypothetical protein GCK72_024034 [Caenorhabditis remanei]
MGNGSLETSVGGIVLEQVDHVVDRDEWIVDGNNIDAVFLDGGAEDETSDSSESVDSDTWLRHGAKEQFPEQVLDMSNSEE